MSYRFRLKFGVAKETSLLLDAAQYIYHTNRPDIQEVEGEIYRARIEVAISTKNADDHLEYADLAWKAEISRHPTSMLIKPIIAIACNDLAVALACHSEWERAIDLLEDSKEIFEEQQFLLLYHLGLIFQHQGELDKAKEVLKKANEAVRDQEDVYDQKSVFMR